MHANAEGGNALIPLDRPSKPWVGGATPSWRANKYSHLAFVC